MANKKVKNLIWSLKLVEILLIIFFLLALALVYLQAIIFDQSIKIFLLALLGILLLFALFIHTKLENLKYSFLEKFCQKYNFTITRQIQSLSALNKKGFEIFANIEKPVVIFHAQKAIKKTKAELYIVEYTEGRKKLELLILELANSKIGSGKSIIISKSFEHDLHLNTSNLKTDSTSLNLKFDTITKFSRPEDIFSHINTQAILNYKFPLGIAKENNKILVFTNAFRINPDLVETLWQTLDRIGVD